MNSIPQTFFEEQHLMSSKDRKSLLDYNKNLLYVTLKANKIKTVLVEFDGSGDSGTIYSVHLSNKSYADITCDDEDFNNILGEVFVFSVGFKVPTSGPEFGEADSTIEEVIKNICYNLIEIEHPGWEYNDGAYGEFVFDIENDKITYTHNTRITDIESHEHSY